MKESNRFTLDSLLVVLVVYEKSLLDVKFLSSVRNSGLRVEIFVYDNSQREQEKDVFDLNLKYVHNSNNPGVSTAYNIAFDYAKSSGKSAVLLLDQDTNFDSEILNYYIDKLNEHGEGYIYAPIITNSARNKIYSPSHMKCFVGKALVSKSFEYKEVYDLSNKSVINSGLLVPICIHDKIGGYNNRIKLDFSDIYFIEKYKEINRNVILMNCSIEHSLSGDDGVNFSAEMKRFPFYCVGALQLSQSMSKSTYYTVLRRTVRLVLKYRSFVPFFLFYKYFIKKEEI